MEKHMRPLKPVKETIEWEDSPSWTACPAFKRGLRRMLIAFTLAGGAFACLIATAVPCTLGSVRQPRLTRATRAAEIDAEIARIEAASSESTIQIAEPADQ